MHALKSGSNTKSLMFWWHSGLQRTQCASKRMRTTGFEVWESRNNQSPSTYPHTEYRPRNDLSDQGPSDSKAALGVPPSKTLHRQVGAEGTRSSGWEAPSPAGMLAYSLHKQCQVPSVCSKLWGCPGEKEQVLAIALRDFTFKQRKTSS